MVALYAGINPKGLVLRENFRIRKTTRPTTTTPEPTTDIMITTSTSGAHNKTFLVIAAAASSVSPNDDDTNTTMSLNTTSAETSGEVLDVSFNSSYSYTIGDDVTKVKVPSLVESDDIVTVTSVEKSNERVSTSGEGGNGEVKMGMSNYFWRRENSGDSIDSLNSNKHSTTTTPIPWSRVVMGSGVSESSLGYLEKLKSRYSGKTHNLRHKLSRIFKFVSSDFSEAERRGQIDVWPLRRVFA